MDYSNVYCMLDFYKIGGCSLLVALLQSSNPDMRWNAAELVATLVQNNPYCQKAVVDTPELLTLLYRTLDEDEVDLVKVKALYAISCKYSCCCVFLG